MRQYGLKIEELNKAYTNTGTWYTMNFANENITNGINYILNTLGNDDSIITTTNELATRYDVTSNTYHYEGTGVYATNKDNPWINTADGTRTYSIYATYTATVAGGNSKTIINGARVILQGKTIIQ